MKKTLNFGQRIFLQCNTLETAPPNAAAAAGPILLINPLTVTHKSLWIREPLLASWDFNHFCCESLLQIKRTSTELSTLVKGIPGMLILSLSLRSWTHQSAGHVKPTNQKKNKTHKKNQKEKPDERPKTAMIYTKETYFLKNKSLCESSGYKIYNVGVAAWRLYTLPWTSPRPPIHTEMSPRMMGNSRK